MRVLKQNILSYFKSKRLNIFLLFILLALLFSVLSKLSLRYTKSFTFKINAINVPEDHIIISDSTNIMGITLTTHGFRHLKYYLREPQINVDFSSLDNTASYYKWIETKEISKIIAQFDANIRIDNITPDTISFRYDVNSVKMVPIKLNADVKFSAGYDITNVYQLEPDSIKIIGPKIITDSIHEINTKLFKLENVNANINSNVELNFPKKIKDLKISNTEIAVKALVERFTEGSIDIPVNVINITENLKINFYPKTVPVIFYTSLSNFKSISSSSFIVECDFSTLKENNSLLVPKIVQRPENVKSAKLNIKQIEFIIIQ